MMPAKESETTMKRTLLTDLLMITMFSLYAYSACGCAIDDEVNDPMGVTSQPRATEQLDDGPTCEACSGPGCEEQDQACQNVESASYAITCDEGADPGERSFVTYYRKGTRTAICYCDPGDCW